MRGMHWRHIAIFVASPLQASQKAFMGSPLSQTAAACRVQPFRVARSVAVRAEAEPERLRLHNLSPQKGSRRDEKRKGRGYGGHQVCSS